VITRTLDFFKVHSMLSSPSIQRDSMLVSNLSSLYVFVLLITKQYIMSNSSSILYGCFTGGRLMSYLRYLCVCLCIVVSNTYYVVFFCFSCLRLVYPMLPVSLDCPFFIALSVFSNVYLQYK